MPKFDIKKIKNLPKIPPPPPFSETKSGMYIQDTCSHLPNRCGYEGVGGGGGGGERDHMTNKGPLIWESLSGMSILRKANVPCL